MKEILYEKRNTLLITILICFPLIFLYSRWSLYSSANCLGISHYEITAKELASYVRIVQLTDLHNSVFGEENEKLISCVKDQKPDLILITGDLVNANEENTEIAVSLLQNLCDIAPVYVSFGNHEIQYEQSYGVDLEAMYEATGATVLEFAYEDITVNGETIRLGGFYGYGCVDGYYIDGVQNLEDPMFISEFQDTDLCTILMCHMPVSWIEWGSLDYWDINLVFSGHAHGGQIRIPFVGGLYAPDQGWFVGREEGLYYSQDHNSTMVLSRGLGSGSLIPRINNKPEIVVVDLFSEE